MLRLRRERQLRSAQRLTLVAVMIGVMTCPFPTGEDIELTPFLFDGRVEVGLKDE